MPLPSPAAPFDAWPVQVADEAAALHAWFVPPATVVFQYHRQRFGLAEAKTMVALIDGVRDAHRAAIVANGGLVMIHDLRQVTELTWEAQRSLRDAWPRLPAAEARASVLIGLRLNVFLLSVIHAISAAARLFTGIELTLVPDFGACAQRFPVATPAPSVQFPQAQERPRSSA